jgi:hypothetical protein
MELRLQDFRYLQGGEDILLLSSTEKEWIGGDSKKTR